MKITFDIDAPIPADLKRLGRAQHISMGRLGSELLGRALREAAPRHAANAKFTWVDKPMNAKVDLADRDALYEAI